MKDMTYAAVCDVYEQLEGTTKGLEKTDIIASFLEKIIATPEYIYLLQGRVFPDYDPRELGLSAQLVMRIIAKASGHTDADVLQLFKEKGDLGSVALELVGVKKQQQSLFNQSLSVKKVFENLRRITTFEGKGTVEQKIGLVVELLHSATKVEVKYIIRTVLGDLKVGVGDGLLRDAIVEFAYHPTSIAEKKAYAQRVQEAYDRATDFAVVFSHAHTKNLDAITLSPGKPVKVMLYPKVSSAEEAFRTVGSPAAFEYKYDGFRVMINKDKEGEIKIFTRRLEEVTTQFPDIVHAVTKQVSGKNFIIDGEVVGYDATTKRYREFQSVSQRIRRKYEIDRLVSELPVELRLFDVIYFEGKSLINTRFLDRRRLLERIVRNKPWTIALAEQIITDDIHTAEAFFAQALDAGQEGLMVKGLDREYKPGARVGFGVKWKPIDNDFDLVITGAEWGTGKRAGWLTSFDVACNNDGELLEVGKVSTGLKEKTSEGLSYEEMTTLLKDLELEEHGRTIKVSPQLVVTVQYQNIQRSPTYKSGYALRFPRIVRLRPDRGVDDIATLDEIAQEV